MPVFAGEKSQTLYWGAGNADGTSNVRLYLGDKLVYVPFRPPEGDLLLAGSGVYLKGGADVYLDYKNTPRVLLDSLSGKAVGTGPFDISFDFTPGSAAGTKYLFEVPGLARFGYDLSKGYGLLVYLQGVGWLAVGTQSAGGPVQEGTNQVRLYHADANADIRLKVNNSEFTLVQAWTEWERVAFTNNACYGTTMTSGVEPDNGLVKSSDAWKLLKYNKEEDILQDWGAAPLFVHYLSSDLSKLFWKWTLPLDKTFRFSGAKLFTQYWGAGYESDTPLSVLENYASNYSLEFCASENREERLGEPFTYDEAAWFNIGPHAPKGWFGWHQFTCQPTVIKELVLYVIPGPGQIYSAFGGLFLGYVLLDLQEYHCPSFKAGKLAFFSVEEVKNLILKDSFGG